KPQEYQRKMIGGSLAYRKSAPGDSILAPARASAGFLCVGHPKKGARAMARHNAPSTYRFSFGPWNISAGADPFGPPVRRELEFSRKIKAYKELGFDAVQFDDDDIAPADLDWAATQKGVAAVKSMLEGEGLFV